MTFDECVRSIHKNSVITFREYNIDRHEHKHLSLEIDSAVVQYVIPAGESIDREKLEKLYGEGLDEVDYLQLSTMNCPRIVVGVGLDDNNQLKLQAITLNKDFYNLGIQTIDVMNELIPEGNTIEIMDWTGIF